MKPKIKNKTTIKPVPKKTIKQRRFQNGLIALMLVLLFGLLAIYVHQSPRNNLDLAITIYIQKFQPFGFLFLMQALTFMGNNISAAILTLAIAALFWFKKQVKVAVMIMLSTLGVSFISTFFKLLVLRPRPDPKLIHQIVKFAKNDSFPSGHVLFYIGLFGFLFFLVYSRPKDNKFRMVLLIFLTLLILLIGLSRIYLGAHWFSDILGSYLIGFFWLIIITNLYKRWLKYE